MNDEVDVSARATDAQLQMYANSMRSTFGQGGKGGRGVHGRPTGKQEGS